MRVLCRAGKLFLQLPRELTLKDNPKRVRLTVVGTVKPAFVARDERKQQTEGAMMGSIRLGNVTKFLMFGAIVLMFASAAHAQTGQSNAKKPTPAQKLEPVLPAQPPEVSTTTKPSVLGVPASEFKPTPPKMNIKEPPSPGKK